MFWLRMPSRRGSQAGANLVGSNTLARTAPTAAGDGHAGVYFCQLPSGGGRTSWLLVQVA